MKIYSTASEPFQHLASHIIKHLGKYDEAALKLGKIICMHEYLASIRKTPPVFKKQILNEYQCTYFVDVINTLGKQMYYELCWDGLYCTWLLGVVRSPA